MTHPQERLDLDPHPRAPLLEPYPGGRDQRVSLYLDESACVALHIYEDCDGERRWWLEGPSLTPLDVEPWSRPLPRA